MQLWEWRRKSTMIKSYINLIFGEVSADGVKFHWWV